MIQKHREFLVTEVPSEYNCSLDKHFSSKDIHLRADNDPPGELAQTIPDSFLLSYQIPSIRDDSLFNQPDMEAAIPQKYHMVDMEEGKDTRRLKTCSAKKRMSDKKESLNKLFQRIRTEMSNQTQKQKEEDEKVRRPPQRRMCKLKTKQEFFQQCKDYVAKKQKEGVDQLFRQVNRAMKTSQQKEQGNVFYENIRKEALNKIQYMYSNQKYYDDEQVRHLHSVVESCNALIHKKIQKIDAKPLYNRPKANRSQFKRKVPAATDNKAKYYVGNSKRTLQKQDLNNQSQYPAFNNVEDNLKKKYSIDKSMLKKRGGNCSSGRIRQKQQKMNLSEKLFDIVNACEKEKEQLRGVKTGMRIFEYYCGRVSSGMQSREVKIGKYLKWEEL